MAPFPVRDGRKMYSWHLCSYAVCRFLFFFRHLFLFAVAVKKIKGAFRFAGLSSGLLLLMCYSSRNTETTYVETGHWERHRFPTLVNGDCNILYFALFLSIDLGAAMLAPTYSGLRECKCDQLVSSPRHSKASSLPHF